MDNIYLTNKLWFPPINVIYHFKKLENEGKLIRGTKSYKKAHEAYITAIFLVGLMKILDIDFWLQLGGYPFLWTPCLIV